MKTITLENNKKVEISDESYRELQKAVQTPKRWRAEKEEYYWCTSKGKLNKYKDFRDSIDDSLYNQRDYFETEKEAQTHLDRLNAIARVSDAIDEANDGWEPDFHPSSKYMITCKNGGFSFKQTHTRSYFTTLPVCKNQEIVTQIIKDHKTDLWIIWT